jgi:Domain of unknown function (DUF5916)
MNRVGVVLFCLPIALFGLCRPGWGQDETPPAGAAERRTMTALRLDEAERVVLDGVLDEEIWQRAIPATDFIQQEPRLGEPATERTEVRIVYNRQRLYLGVICFDSEPDKLLGFQLRRDENPQSDDRFQWTMDTFLSGRDGYFFEMNPSGLMADALLTAGGGQNRQWDGIWTAKVRRSDIGWTAEIEIPFQTLNFDPNASAWGINFQRTVRRKNEESLWTGYQRNQGLRRMANAGLLEGIREVSQGHGFDVKPYVTGTAFSAPGRMQNYTVYKGAVGGDLSYTPTPQLRASLSINTDFAQTEVDQRQVNLTRFSLFFPERREFFLEGVNFFDFRSTADGGAGFGGLGGTGVRLRPYFSRQIGLNADGAPQKILFGARLAGQVGKQDIGILHVRTGEDNTSPGEDITVARLKRRILAQSYIGALVTRRDPRQPGSLVRNTLGLDMLLSTSRFRGSDNLELGAFIMGASNQPGQHKGNLASGFTVNYPNDPWDASFDFRDVQANFDPALGDVSRTDFRSYTPVVSYSPRPRNNRWIRNFLFGANFNTLTDRQNKLLTREFSLTVFQVDFNSQDRLTLKVNPQYQWLRPGEGSSISGIKLPIGNTYSFTRYNVSFLSAARRMISVQPSVEFGPFYSGHRDQFNLNLNVRIRPGLLVFTTTQYNRVRLAEGRVQTRLFRIGPEWQLGPWASLTNNIQYDSVSRALGWQARFRWIFKAGNDFFLVYTHNWTDDPLSGLATFERSLSTKVIYTKRF